MRFSHQTENSSKPPQKGHADGRSMFVYMCSHRFWLGLFDTVDLTFIRNLFVHKVIEKVDVLMTVFVPPNTSKLRLHELSAKEEQMSELASSYGARISFLHLRGRSLRTLLDTPARINCETKGYGKRFIWAKNYFNCFMGVISKKRYPDIRLHFDMSGLVPEEVFYYTHSVSVVKYAAFLALKVIEKINLRNADTISVVSSKFKDYIVTQNHISAVKVSITPVFFDFDRFYINPDLRAEYRASLGLNEQQKVILYSGTLLKWQEPQALFAFMKHIQDQDPGHEFRFVVLTFDKERAENYAREFQIEDIRIETASGEELNGYYNATDIGIALRSNDKVSYFSSPVKIPEYLATGNSLITMEHIGDFGRELQNKKYVLVKKSIADLLVTGIDEVKALVKPQPADLEEVMQKYSIKRSIEVIKRIVKQNLG